jgi:hypothetical protein
VRATLHASATDQLRTTIVIGALVPTLPAWSFAFAVTP